MGLLAVEKKLDSKLDAHSFNFLEQRSKILIESILSSNFPDLQKIFEELESSSRHYSSFKFFPELMSCFGMLDLSHQQKRDWSKVLIDPYARDGLSESVLNDFALIFQQIGTLTFSFPTWRFIAQRLKDANDHQVPALLEKMNFFRLERKSDKEWITEDGRNIKGQGVGYTIIDSQKYIEYRQGNLLIALEGCGALMIANSSYYFGRDLFQRPAYFTPKELSIEKLSSLSIDDVDFKKELLPVTDLSLLQAQFGVSAWEASIKISSLVGTLFQFDLNLSNKLINDPRCRNILTEDLSLRAERHMTDPQKNPLPYLAICSAKRPPWVPLYTVPATLENLSSIIEHTKNPGIKFSLLSGATGDLPFRKAKN